MYICNLCIYIIYVYILIASSIFYYAGGITSINLLCGLAYITPMTDSKLAGEAERKPRLSLVLTKRSSTVFLVETEPPVERSDQKLSEDKDDNSVDLPTDVTMLNLSTCTCSAYYWVFKLAT